VQESLTNIARHSQARQAHIRLSTAGKELVLEVEDDGRGFAPKKRSGNAALGIVGMREPALALGGTLEIQSKPGSGTVLCVRVPLNSSVSGGHRLDSNPDRR